MVRFTLSKDDTGLLIIDLQQKIFSAMEKNEQLLAVISTLIKGFQVLDLPIILSEQYPQGLGETIEPIKKLLGNRYQPWIKSTFSCMDDQKFAFYLDSLPIKKWVLAGIEAHVCVLQTAKGLLSRGKQVLVVNQGGGSRFQEDYLTAIAEMREDGVRISGMETILFELVQDSKFPTFKPISSLIKSHPGDHSSCLLN
jgi:nicotinamidase-related amidase